MAAGASLLLFSLFSEFTSSFLAAFFYREIKRRVWVRFQTGFKIYFDLNCFQILYFEFLNMRRKRRGGFVIKPYEKHKIEFNPNNFEFYKTCKGEICMIMHKKIK
jgi:hypothetical protein